MRLDGAGHVYVTHVSARKNGNAKKQIIKLNYLDDFIAPIFHISEHYSTSIYNLMNFWYIKFAITPSSRAFPID